MRKRGGDKRERKRGGDKWEKMPCEKCENWLSKNGCEKLAVKKMAVRNGRNGM